MNKFENEIVRIKSPINPKLNPKLARRIGGGRNVSIDTAMSRCPIPDKDLAEQILDELPHLYRETGLPGRSRRQTMDGLEARLYGGSASEQAKTASELAMVREELAQAVSRTVKKP